MSKNIRDNNLDRFGEDAKKTEPRFRSSVFYLFKNGYLIVHSMFFIIHLRFRLIL